MSLKGRGKFLHHWRMSLKGRGKFLHHRGKSLNNRGKLLYELRYVRNLKITVMKLLFHNVMIIIKKIMEMK